MVCRMFLALALLLIVGAIVRAQTGEMPMPDEQLAPWRSPMDGFAPSASAVSGPRYVPPVQDHPEPIGEPPWDVSPYRSSAWRFEIDLIPTISHVSEEAFGNWADNGSLALRLSLGYEGCDGVGTRLQFWGFADRQNTMAGDVELDA